MKLFLSVTLVIILSILTACSKDDRRLGSQSAVLARKVTSCNYGADYPDQQGMIIYTNNNTDSATIANLPLKYKVGDHITFDIRNQQPEDGPMMCVMHPVLPKFIYVTNISKVDAK